MLIIRCWSSGNPSLKPDNINSDKNELDDGVHYYTTNPNCIVFSDKCGREDSNGFLGNSCGLRLNGDGGFLQ